MRGFVLLAVLWLIPCAGFAQPAQQPPARFLVIPFENPSREARVYWLGEASAVLIADGLNATNRRAYTREERLDAFAELQVPPIASLSHATVIRLGQVVGATHVVIGSFRLNAGQISVRAQTIRLDSGRMELEVVESGKVDDLFGIFDRVSSRLSGATVPAATKDRPALPVFENYVKGLVATATPAKIGYLEAALKLDPAYDRARLALWQVHYDEGNAQQALVTAAAVAESSPVYARARFNVALSLMQLKRLDDAFATLRTMADRSPSAPLMNNIGVIQMGRPVTPQTGRASFYFNQALKLDQDDPDYYFNVGYAYWAEKDAQSAIFWLRETVRRNPADGEAHAVLAAALQATGSRPRRHASASSRHSCRRPTPNGRNGRPAASPFRADWSASRRRSKFRRCAASTTPLPCRVSASRRSWPPFTSTEGSGFSSRGTTATPRPN